MYQFCNRTLHAALLPVARFRQNGKRRSGEVERKALVNINGKLQYNNFFSKADISNEIAELAKKLVDENQAKKAREEYGFEETFETGYKKENPVEHAIMVKASEADDNRLVG